MSRLADELTFRELIALATAAPVQGPPFLATPDDIHISGVINLPSGEKWMGAFTHTVLQWQYAIERLGYGPNDCIIAIGVHPQAKYEILKHEYQYQDSPAEDRLSIFGIPIVWDTWLPRNGFIIDMDRNYRR